MLRFFLYVLCLLGLISGLWGLTQEEKAIKEHFSSLEPELRGKIIFLGDSADARPIKYLLAKLLQGDKKAIQNYADAILYSLPEDKQKQDFENYLTFQSDFGDLLLNGSVPKKEPPLILAQAGTKTPKKTATKTASKTSQKKTTSDNFSQPVKNPYREIDKKDSHINSDQKVAESGSHNYAPSTPRTANIGQTGSTGGNYAEADSIAKANLHMYSDNYDPTMDLGCNFKKEKKNTSNAKSNSNAGKFTFIPKDEADSIIMALIGIESGGDIDITHPVTGAAGLGQITPDNIHNWSLEILHYHLTTEEFCQRPDLQYDIMHAKIMQYLQLAKGTPKDKRRHTYSRWFTGRNYCRATWWLKDANGTTNYKYVRWAEANYQKLRSETKQPQYAKK